MVSRRCDGNDGSLIGSTINQYFCILLPNEGEGKGREGGREGEEKGRERGGKNKEK